MPVCFTRPALFSVTVCLKRKKKKAHVVHIDYTIIIIHNSLFEIVLPGIYAEHCSNSTAGDLTALNCCQLVTRQLCTAVLITPF